VTAPRLVLVAHGSADPRFAEVVEAVAARVRGLLRDVDVRPAYLEHGPPHVSGAAGAGAVVVPLLLSAGYHAQVDLPAQAPGATITRAVGPDDRLAVALRDRLLAAGWEDGPVTLVGAGSADPNALADVRRAAEQLGLLLRVPVDVAFVSAGEPRLADLRPAAVASYLLAPGFFHDEVRRLTPGPAIVSEPLGDHPAVAEVVAERYRAALG
jgi:sirohydrochlorin ferrochelatase